MAFKIGALKMGRGGAEAPAAKPAATSRGLLSGPLPVLGRMRVGVQLQILTTALVFFLVVDGAIVALDARQGTIGTAYIAAVGKIRMLSQRLAKAAQQASQGNREAFKQLRQSRDEFDTLMKVLATGGSAEGVQVPATAEGAKPALDKLEGEWRKTERNASLVIGEEKNLVALGEAVRRINQNNPTLLELADEIAALSVQAGGSARQNAVTGQLVMMTQRMAKNANAMLASDVVDPEVAFLLGKDTNTFRDMLQGLLKGSDALRIQEVRDPEIKGKLSELEVGFREYQGAVADILGNQQRLVNAKRATRDIFNDSETLLAASERLNEAYQGELEARTYNFIALGVVSALAFITLLLV
ncbi:MAG TPA: type IV pili methyl-accepting chemotaxis transducer N-terminal domain-containing protein, partial [Burkholderiales bacterium]|nr:type IV pili methyl-accepting chemotaxis transducer N-terminal domain-containing protein [Burkholderiales bacterium]